MDITFRSSDLCEQCNNHELLIKKHGKQRAKLIRRRLDDLKAATILDHMYHVAGHFHPLSENRAEQFAMYLDGPWRLVFEAATNPIPRKEDGGLDLTRITAVEIVEVINYHD